MDLQTTEALQAAIDAQGWHLAGFDPIQGGQHLPPAPIPTSSNGVRLRLTPKVLTAKPSAASITALMTAIAAITSPTVTSADVDSFSRGSLYDDLNQATVNGVTMTVTLAPIAQ